jgi:hypothetical protein
MDNKRKFSTRLLSSIREEASSAPTRALILTTLVAVSGSYVFGSAVSIHLHLFLCFVFEIHHIYIRMTTITLILQVGYSSPAQSGIMDDLNLDVAEV